MRKSDHGTSKRESKSPRNTDSSGTSEEPNRLAKLSEAFHDLGSDPLANISRLTALAGELLGAASALYNRLDGGMLCSWGQWNTPPGYVPVDKPEGHICYDVIRRGSDQVLLIQDLPHTDYARTDPNVSLYGLQTYVGAAVALGDSYVGSLCTVFQKDFVPTEQDKEILRVIAAAIAVEERRKQAEEKLESEQSFTRTILETSGALVVVLDKHGRIVRFNRTCERITGYSADEVEGKAIWDILLTPEEREPVKEVFEQLRAGRFPNEFENDWVSKDGGRRRIAWSNTALVDKRGEVEYVIGTGIDITDRKVAEEELRRKTELLQRVTNTMPEFVFWKDRNSVYLGSNESFARYVGASSPEEIVGKTDYDLPWGKEQADAYREFDRRIMRSDSAELHVVEKATRADGSEAWVDISKAPLHDAQGRVIGVVGVYEDITEKKRAADELLERRRQERKIRREAEEAKRQFYRGTVFSITGGKLNLVTYDEIKAILTPDAQEIPLITAEDSSVLRQTVTHLAQQEGMSEERTYALVNAAGEAAANAIKHAKGGCAQVGIKDGYIQVCVQDRGGGIDALVLPQATLLSGFSTGRSMGLGYSIILASVDTVYLATSAEGTWVLMQKALRKPPETVDLASLPDTW